MKLNDHIFRVIIYAVLVLIMISGCATLKDEHLAASQQDKPKNSGDCANGTIFVEPGECIILEAPIVCWDGSLPTDISDIETCPPVHSTKGS